MFDLRPRRRGRWTPTHELIHVVFWDAVKIHTIPVPCEYIGYILCVMLRLTSAAVRHQPDAKATPHGTNMIHAFSFALINSENVKTGMPASSVTVD